MTAARGTIQLLVGRGCFMVSAYAITIMLARGLTPTQFGIYGVIMSVLIWLEVLGNAGMLHATSKLVAESEDSTAAAQASRALLVALSVVVLAVCWPLAPFFASFFDIENGATLFRIAVLDIPLNGLYLAYQGLLQGQRRFGTLSFAIVVYSISKLLGILALLGLGFSVAAALIVNILATVGALIFLVTKDRPTIWIPSRQLVRSMVRIALPIGVFMLTLQVLISLDLWALKHLLTKSGEAVGFYVAALNVARLAQIVPIVLTGVVYASISGALSRNDQALAASYAEGAVRFMLIVLVPCCLLGVFHAEPLMTLIYSKTYAPGSEFLHYQLIAFCLFAFLDTLLIALLAANMYRQTIVTLIALVPVALLLNMTLIPAMGPAGAAMALLLTMALGTGVAVVVTQKHFGPLFNLATIARVVFASGLVTVLGSQVEAGGLWLVLELAVLMSVYAVLLGLLKELTWEDLKAFAIWKTN